MKVLFIVGKALGHIGRALVVARAIRELCPAKIIFTANNPSGHLERYVLPHGIDIVSLGDVKVIPPEIYASRVEDVFASINPDIIVIDGSPVPWLVFVRFPSVPQAYLTNFFLTRLGDHETAQDRLFKGNREICNRYRKHIGLEEIESARELYERDAVILADPNILLPGNLELPENYAISGAIWWEPESSLPDELEGVDDILYISVGSTGKYVPEILLKSIINHYDVRHIVEASSRGTTGFSGLIKVPISSYSNVPGSRVLSQSVFAITQGGAGSTYQALKAGIPIGLWPNHLNHLVLAQHIEKTGVGVILDPDTIEEALARMKDNWQRAPEIPRQFSSLDPVVSAQNAAQVIINLM